MIFGLLGPIVFIALLIFVIRKVASGGSHGGLQGHSVRRFFQYLLLYGLIIVVAIGLSGLLGRLLDRGTLVAADQTALARDVSFVVVGIPLYIVVGLWTRKKFLADSAEVQSFGWGFYFTAAPLTFLVGAMFALHDTFIWAFANGRYSAPSLARLIVWGVLWALHWWLDVRLTPARSSRSHHLIGSLIGLGTVVFGLGEFLTSLIERVWKLGGDTLFIQGGNPILRSLATLVVGIPVWFLYWIWASAKSKRDPMWLAYVLLAGVGGGLILAVTFASTALYSVLAWFIGDPSSTKASIHFQNIPTAIAFTCVGIIAWWYHHAVLDQEREATRSEVQRVYEYLMAGIGLIAAAGGLTMVLVALLDAIVGGTAITGTGGTGAVNALLAAATLLVVGGPVWWIFWRRIESAVQKMPSPEYSSPTRRIYLFILFGMGGLATAVVLLIGVFFLFDDIFKGNFGSDTFHRMRFPIGILVTTGAVAGYHWMIYRAEREQVIAGQHGPRFVLLVGPKDPELIRELAHRTGARVQAWARKEEVGEFGSVEDLVAILERTSEESIILLADTSGVRAIPVDRG